MSRHRAKLKRVLYLPFLALLLSNFGTLMAGALNPQHLPPGAPPLPTGHTGGGRHLGAPHPLPVHLRARRSGYEVRVETISYYESPGIQMKANVRNVYFRILCVIE